MGKKKIEKKAVVYVEERGYYKNNGKIDNINEVIDKTKEFNHYLRHRSNKFFSDFKKFIAKGSIIDLAVALAITTAFNALVNSIVSSFINPLVGTIMGTVGIKDLKYVITPAVEANEELGIAAVKEVAITYGVFLDALINFLIIAFSLYLFVKLFLRLQDAIHYHEHQEEKLRLEKEKEENERLEKEKQAELERKEKEREELLHNIQTETDLLIEIRDLLKQQKSSKE